MDDDQLPPEETGEAHLPLQVGEVVGKYRISAPRVEKGAFSVYEATHDVLGSTHQLKVSTLFSPTVNRRLLLEGQAQATIKDPHLHRVTDVFTTDRGTVVVFESLEAVTLSESLANEGLPEIDAVLNVFSGIVRGVRAAHREGLRHGSVHPSNVLLVEGDDGVVAKITGFEAAAKRRDDPYTSAPGELTGYTAPEILLDASKADLRSDLYSLGCVFYEMLTGQPPFEGTDPFEVYGKILAGDRAPVEQFRPDVSDEVLELLEDLLVADPEKRVQTAEDVLDALSWFRERTIEVYLPDLMATQKNTAAPQGSQNRMVWIAGSVLLAVFLFFFTLGMLS